MLVSSLDDNSVLAGILCNGTLPLDVSLYSLNGEMLNTRGSEEDQSGRAVGSEPVKILHFHTAIFKNCQLVGACWSGGQPWLWPSPESVDDLKQNGTIDAFVLFCAMSEIVTRSPPDREAGQKPFKKFAWGGFVQGSTSNSLRPSRLKVLVAKIEAHRTP